MHTKHSMIPRLCKRRSTPRSVLRERITTKERIHGFSSNECILFTCVCHIVLSYTPTVFFGCVTTLNNSSVSNHWWPSVCDTSLRFHHHLYTTTTRLFLSLYGLDLFTLLTVGLVDTSYDYTCIYLYSEFSLVFPRWPSHLPVQDDMIHWIVKKDSNAKKESYCYTELYTKFTTQINDKTQTNPVFLTPHFCDFLILLLRVD